MTEHSGEGLAGLRVLVTRPTAQAQRLCKAIRAIGGRPIELPMLDICVFPEDGIEKDKILNLDYYDIVIVVSANAAVAGLDLVDRYWPQLPSGTTWLAVGSATAQLLEQYGIDVKIPQLAANSEGLLQMPELQHAEGLRILIMKGQGGREILSQALTAAGARVDTLDLYKRNLPGYSVNEIQLRLNEELPDVVLATSVNILDNLEAIVAPRLPLLRNLPLIAASHRIAEHARRLGYKKVILANAASDEAMVAALKSIP